MTGRKPFKLIPAFQDYLWGGSRLTEDFGKTPDENRFPEGTPIAESWECSTHPDGMSMAAGAENGTCLPLTELLARHPDFAGTHPESAPGTLPVLIKLIDASRKLSVQVHPDDAYAKVHENGSLGKTEMWYIMEAAPGAKIVYGLTRTLTRGELTEILRQGKIERYLQEVPVRKGDVFYIPAGTVHALGEGIVALEVQESSNLTYRLYDYDRTGKDGKKRDLHVEKALAVMDLTGCPAPRQKIRLLRYRRGYASEFLCRCPYFQVERVLMNTEALPAPVPFATQDTSFAVLICTEGAGELAGEDVRLSFARGDSVFVPAASDPLTLTGKAELILVTC